MPVTDARSGSTLSPPPRVLIVVNVEWFFLSHRLPIALGLKDAGCDVEVAAGVEQGLDTEIERHGLRFTRLALRRASMNPLHDLMLLVRLYRLYRSKRPDVVHHVAIKPVLYGSLAARLARVPAIVNAVPGLGYLFSDGTGLKAIKARLAMFAYRLSCRGRQVRLIFQNPEDRDSFVAAGVAVPARTVLIRGSGVDVRRFQPSPEPEGPPVVLMASRMLWDKGVAELVEAARLLRTAGGPPCRFVLAGDPDVANPRSVPAAQLEAWQREGVLEWWGHQRDMPAVMRQAALVVFPSFYREGVPKVLLEACAAGRAIITTDLPGCREVVRHGENGLLVPPRDIRALAEAIAALLADPALRERMGRAGRIRAVEEFSETSVVDATLRLYREILGSRWPGAITPEPEGRTLGAPGKSRTST
jgi:glycosyltransferase involved in cell wall biosynthesis